MGRAAAAALVLLAALPGAVPSAQAQTTVWEATVTAGTAANSGFGFIATAHPYTADFGSISDNDFDLDGTTYTVWRVNVASNDSFWANFAVATGATPAVAPLPSTLLSELSLEITANTGHSDGADTKTLPLSGATYTDAETSSFNAGYRWGNSSDDIAPDIDENDVFTVKLIRTPPPNNAATGAPVITGTAQVGQTLTAGQGSIADADGLPTTFPDDYTFQWIQVDGGDETELSGFTSPTYVPRAEDVGKTLKVKVSFTDDAGNDESLTSAATAAVTAAVVTPPPQSPNAVWSATVTAGQSTEFRGYGYLAAGHPAPEAFGSISDNDFDLDGTTYTVWRVSVTSENGHLDFSVATGATPVPVGFPGGLLSELTLKVTANQGHADGADVVTRSLTEATYNDSRAAYRFAISGIDPEIRDSHIFFAELIRTSTNNAPTVANPIGDQTATVGTEFTFTVPEDAFADTDTGDTLTYSATLSDASALPSWLTFDTTTRTFTGTPTTAGTITVRVTATDGSDASIHDDFDIVVSEAFVCTVPELTGRDVHWTATLTAAANPNNPTEVGFEGGVRGTISPADFSIGTTDYTVSDLVHQGPANIFFRLSTTSAVLTAEQVAVATLHICDTELAFSSAGEVNARTYIWGSVTGGPLFSADNQVTVRFSTPTPPSDNAALSALTLANAADDTNIALTPAFDSATTDYDADAGAAARVTVAPTTDDDNATVAYGDDGGNALTDADGDSTNGFQVDIPLIENVIAIIVTAEDGVTTKKYQLTVTRDATATVSGVSVTSTAPRYREAAGANPRDVYGAGDVIEFTVTFSDTVDVDTANGVPRLVFSLGTGAAAVRTNAPYARGSGTSTLVFAYAVQAGDADSDGIFLLDDTDVTGDGGALQLNGGVLSTGSDGAVSTATTFRAAQADHKVDGGRSGPYVESLAVTSTPLILRTGETEADTYGAGETIEFTLTLSEAVTVTGTPHVQFSLGGTNSNADYTRGSGSDKLVFAYAVQAADADADGLFVQDGQDVSGSDSAVVVETGESIAATDDSADADLVNPGRGLKSGHRVDGAMSAFDTAAPMVLSIVRQDPAVSPTNADSLTWRVTFSEDVANVDNTDFTVSGTTAALAVAEVTAATVHDVTASGGNLADLDGTVTLGFASTQNIADTADTPNALTATTPTGTDERSWVLDNTAPTVTIEDVPATSGAPFAATFTFSEPVTGFVVGDIAVGNGTASDFTGGDGDTVFTATITPAAAGEVTVDVAADAAEDEAGNGNLAATQAKSTYTAPNTAPTAQDSEVTIEEDGFYTASSSDFTFNDLDGDSLHSVIVTALPAAGKGELRFNHNGILGGSGSEPRTLTAADLPFSQDINYFDDFGTLTYHPPANANGDAFATYKFRVSDGTDESVAEYTMTIDITPVNDAPTLENPIGNQSATVDASFSFTVPDDAFGDVDGDTLAYSATKGDDTALPSWLTFTAGTRTFQGTPGAGDAGTVTVKVTASDGTLEASGQFDIVVNEAPNEAPAFDDDELTRSVAENAGPGTNVGAAIPAAADVDGDSLTYTMEGADEASFDFDPATRQIATKSGVDYDFEAKAMYSVTVKADDGKGGTDTVSVAITLTDVSEPPDAPDAPTVTATSGSTTSLDAVWAAPANDGRPEILDYDLRYCAGAPAECTADGDFTDGPRDVTGLGATITGLNEGTVYQVQVRARNDEGDGGWSDSGGGSTATPVNNAPTSDDKTVIIPEDTPYAFTAADFNFADTDGDALASVKITQLESAGDLELDGVDVTLNQVVLKADIDAGKLTFRPAANAHGTGYATFMFRVSDGDDESVSAYTMTVDVDAVNDAPTLENAIANQTATAGESFSFTVPANAFEDVDGDTLTYEAALSNDDPLPSWLSFNATSRAFSGTPGAGNTGTIAVKVTAQDGDGESASDTFDIVVAAAGTGTACPAPDFGTRRQIWTGNMTVGSDRPDYGYAINSYGALDDTTFAIGANNYTIHYIRVGDDRLRLLVRKSEGGGLTGVGVAVLRLHVCNTPYNFSDAAVNDLGTIFQWRNTSLDWSGESTRTLYLSLPANRAATGGPGVSSDGAAVSGDTLTADPAGIADPDGLPDAFTYQWLREDADGSNPAPIPGETSATYTLTNDDVGKRVRVRVGFTDQLGSAETLESGPWPQSGAVAEDPANPVRPNTRASGAPTITGPTGGGAPRVGDTLMADIGAVDDADGLPPQAGFGYQWVREDADGSNREDIPGANGPGYTLVPADTGKVVYVRVTFTDGGGGTETVTSAPTEPVAARAAADGALAEIVADARTVTIVWGEALDPGSVPAPGDFEVPFDFVDGSNRARTLLASLDTVRVAGSTVTLRLDNRLPHDADVRVSYTPGAAPVRYAAGGDAPGFAEAAAENRTPDIEPPKVRPWDQVTVNGATLRITFPEPLDPGSVPEPEGFDVNTSFNVHHHDGILVERVSVSGRVVTLTLARAVSGEEGVSVSYGLTGGTPIRDLAGNESWTGGRFSADNLTRSGAAQGKALTVDGDTVTVVFDAALDAATAPGLHEFRVKKTSTSRHGSYGKKLRTVTTVANIRTVAVSGSTVTLTAYNPADHETTVRLSYVPGDSPLRFSDGTAVDAFSNLPVENLTAGPAAQQMGEEEESPGEEQNSGEERNSGEEESPAEDGPPAEPAPPPIVVSVSGAQVREGPGATLDFVVSLSRPAPPGRLLLVPFRTGDGTAVSGSDYIGLSGRTYIRPGGTSTTLSIKVLDDNHDEGTETMTLTIFDPSEGRIGVGTATGTIVNSDPMPRAWAARFGRTVAEQVLEAVEGRMRASRTPGSELTLAGQRIGLGGAETETETETESESESEFGAMADAESEVGKTAEADAEPEVGKNADSEVGKNGERWLAEWLEGEADEEDRVSWRRGVSDRELLLGSSFGLTMPAGGGLLGGPGGTVSLWGRSSVSRFDGRDGDLGLDGEVVSSLLGGDWALGSGEMTVGLIVGHSRGEGGYRGGSGNGTAGSGTVTSTLTGLYPWGRRALSDRLTVWGAAGHGQGTLTLTPEGDDGESRAAMRTDLDLSMVAAGVRGVVLAAPPGGGPELAVTADATGVRTATDRVRGLAAAAGDVTRLRLGLEGSWAVRLDNGGVLTPSLAVGVRHDGGDAETGHGADIGGGIAWLDPVRGLSAELRARGLLSHESDGFRERGLSGTLAWEPEAGGRGPRFSLTHAAGGSSSGGVDALLGLRTMEGLASGNDDDLGNRRLEARFGYGFPALEDRFTWTPEAGISLWDTGRDYTLGWRLVRWSPGRRGSLGSVELSFEARRHEGAGGDAPRHGVGLRLDVRW